MKQTKFPLKSILTFLALAGMTSANETSLAQPIGSIQSLQNTVVSGEKVDLDWQISFPVHNFNETDTRVTASFITAATGANNTILFGTRVNGEDYTEFYNGVSEDHPDYTVTPGTIISETLVSAGEEIEFLARHSRTRISGNEGWVSSTNPSQRALVIELERGDAIPSVAGAGNQRSVAEILAPYSEDGVLTIGEHQKIILFEIYTTNQRSHGFDLQDVVILVSYEQISLED